MPTETFDIKVFSDGLVTAIDQEDIPKSAASYSENIDGDAVEGRLQGIPNYTTKSTDAELKNMGKNAWIRRDTGEHDLIYTDGTDIRAVQDFYNNSPTESQIIAGVVGTSFITQNKAVHIGTGGLSTTPPKWVGRVEHNIFGGIGQINTDAGGNGEVFSVGGDYTGTTNQTMKLEIYANNNWQHKTSGIATRINKVFFTDANNGWAVGDNGVILTTSNGGGGWTAQTSGTAEHLYGVYFFDLTPMTGVVVGAFGIILLTDDGGVTWNIVRASNPFNQDLNDVSCAKNLWCMVGGNGTILTSNDGLTTIIDHTGLWVAVTLFGVFVVDDRTIFIVGQSGKLMKTNDIFATASSLGTGTVQDLKSISFYNGNGIVTGNIGTILISDNYGEVWTIVSNFTSHNLYACQFTKNNIATVVGQVGDIYITTDLGVTWKKQTSGISTDLYSLFILSDYSVIAVGASGEILQVTKLGCDTYKATDGTAYNETFSVIDSHYLGDNTFQMFTTTNRDNGIKLYLESLTGYTASAYWTFNVYPNTTTINGYNAEVVNSDDFILASLVEKASMGTGIPATLRRYKMTTTFEAISESLLSSQYLDIIPSVGSAIEINITALLASSNPSNYDRRITAINIYVAVGADTKEDSLGSYRLVQNIQVFNNSSAKPSLSPYYAPYFYNLGNGNNKYAKILDDGFNGATYEANTGIPQNADTTIINYELSTQVGGYLFTAKNYSQYLPDAQLMIFRSKELRYDMFDIVNDKLQLNILPTAMAGFNGKLYVWDLNTTIIINIQGLFVENIIHGKGCTSHTSWTVIDVQGLHALIFCDYNNCYITDGSGIKEISDAIKKPQSSSTVGWQTMNHAYMNPIVIFDSVRNTILFLTTVQTSATYKTACLAYHITKNRWDYYPDFTNGVLAKGGLVGKTGETYCSNGSALLNNFGDTSANRAWKWESQQFTFNSPSQTKHLTKFKVEKSATGTLAKSFRLDGSTSAYTAISSGDTITSNPYAYSIQLQITGTAALNYLTSLSLLYRTMIGNR